jgi:hypothetical protein
MVPDITRLIARIEDWKGQGPALGRAEAARRLDEAHKLLEEVASLLTEMRQELLGGGKR